MRISVDKDLCMGTGNCNIEAPEVFGLDHDDYVQLLTSEPEARFHKAVRQAAQGCPAGVIQVHED